ncbi:MAG: hypothetical protein RLZZ08_2097 [Pseudomonadota bacterium]|jgi:hypothetical protein
MRKWHRWLSVFFGIVMIWVAVTGVLHYVGVWWPSAPPSAAQLAAMAPPAGFVCPEGWRCMPPPPSGSLRGMVGLFHHLHSGESFGPVGEVIVMLSGLALVFFSFSGMWMYLQMWGGRSRRGLKGGMFWK